MTFLFLHHSQWPWWHCSWCWWYHLSDTWQPDNFNVQNKVHQETITAM